MLLIMFVYLRCVEIKLFYYFKLNSIMLSKTWKLYVIIKFAINKKQL